MGRQILRVGGCTAPGQIVSACHQHRVGLAQHPGHVGFWRRIGVPYGQIEAFIDQVDEPIGQLQLNVNVRELREKSCNTRSEVLATQRNGRRHAHQTTRQASLIAGRAVAARYAFKRRLHVTHHLLPSLGQTDRPRGAAYQQHPGSTLQLADAHADRRLRCAQPARGFREAFRRGQHGQQMQVGNEWRELVGRHQEDRIEALIVQISEQYNQQTGDYQVGRKNLN